MTLRRGWAVAGIDDVADVLDSQRIPVNRQERALRPGDVPYYGATGQVGWIDAALFDEELCLVGEDGAPFLDRDKPKAYLIDGPSWVNNHAHVLRARPITSNRYLKYVLDATDYRPVVNGTTRLKLTRAGLARIPIPLPPLGEQRRIVAAIEEQFSRLDVADDVFTALVKRLGGLAEALISRATKGKWPVVALSDVTRHQGYGSSAKCSVDPTGTPVLRMGNIDGGRIKVGSLKYLPSDHPDAKKFRLTSGDVLFNRTNSPELVGKTAVYRGDPPDAAFASYLIRVQLSNDCLPAWASLVINSSHGRGYVARVRTQQVGQANVNGTKLAAMPIPLPPLEEQRRIVAELEQQLSLIDSLRAAVESAQKGSAALRRAILERAFRGELVPQDPNDEPASALLERIRAERAAQKTQRQQQPVG